MFEFLAGTAVGFVILYLAEVWRGGRISRRQTRQLRQFASMQWAIFEVQDAAALNWYFPTDDPQLLESRLKEMRQLKQERDRAATAYFAAMEE